ncbi:Flp family type IVb pilin [Alteriqipengyuania lutimaris]|uniref:Flp family type IVb pilin n=1 Tax=Alteriqipengyuania lutimaris TaxID=1538146 RepID=UPI0015F15C0A|nr:Flp family type IVb pilin [Alteriqipengyuania lutimaris]MBB3032688.1 pilus assembly protein Flp/PilA [Alteriqipengyuania lutimaris]
MIRFLKRLHRDRRGATAVEYGLILALIFLAMVGAIGRFANSVVNTWDTVIDTSQAAVERS